MGQRGRSPRPVSNRHDSTGFHLGKAAHETHQLDRGFGHPAFERVVPVRKGHLAGSTRSVPENLQGTGDDDIRHPYGLPPVRDLDSNARRAVLRREPDEGRSEPGRHRFRY